MGKEELLRCEHMYKSFGPTKALVDVELVVKRGEIRGLIGENGSGKSTISSIVAGVQPGDEGRMFLRGKPYSPKTMLDAQTSGVAMIVQEMGTIDNISVAANIFINREDRFRKGPWLSLSQMHEEARVVLKRIGVEDIDPAMSINHLNFEARKLVEIARCMYDDPELLIVDETTTALSQHGREIIYRIMGEMASQNKAVLFISHDMDELVNVCTEVTVLRDGHMVATMERGDMNVHNMRMCMIGREISDHYYRQDFDGSCGEEVVLKMEHISTGTILEDFSLELHKGEVLGLGGLSECGMHEVGRAAFGADQLLTGQVTISDRGTVKTPRDAIRHRMAYISKNRDQESIIQADSIRNNIVLPSIPSLEKGPYISKKAEKQLVEREIEGMNVKCAGSGQWVNQLSGGNKQKVVFAKWLGNHSDIFIMDCPTRGIDIGVKVSMYQKIYDLKQQGKAIILISEELPELIGMCDRLLIMKDGKIAQTFHRSETLKESDIIHYMI